MYESSFFAYPGSSVVIPAVMPAGIPAIHRVA
jgi:hypothetical protein